MEMIFHLDSDIFDIVRDGKKDVEVRLYDEKRRKLHVGDTLIFLKRGSDVEKISARVTALTCYSSFQELVLDYDIERLYLPGYSREEFVSLLGRFYSRSEQEKYGVVAISFQKLS